MKVGLEYPRAGNGGRPHSENLYRDLFEQAPIACFSVGADGRIRVVNGRGLELLGYQPEELVGRRVLDLYADTLAGKAKARELFLRFRAGVEVRKEELEMCRADGTPVWVRLSVQAIRDAEGQVAASCSMVEEITERDCSQESPLAARSGHRKPAANGNDTAERLVALLQDLKFEPEHPGRLLIKSGGCLHFLRVQEIDWIEAAGNYVELHVGPKTHLLRETMKGLEAKLDPCQFLRIHRSAIVNTRRIKELQPRCWGDYRVVLLDGRRLTLSRSYRPKVQAALGNALLALHQEIADLEATPDGRRKNPTADGTQPVAKAGTRMKAKQPSVLRGAGLNLS